MTDQQKIEAAKRELAGCMGAAKDAMGIHAGSDEQTEETKRIVDLIDAYNVMLNRVYEILDE